PSDLMVKSAEFFNGVLKVELAAKKNPEKAWRVDVGIDVGQPGFTSSRITAVSGSTPNEAQAAGPVPGPEKKKQATGPVRGLVAKPAMAEVSADGASDAGKAGPAVGFNVAARAGTLPSPLSSLGLAGSGGPKTGPVKHGRTGNESSE
ncbi:MAG: hypothetical protein V2B18_24640, partial [Pseudomonadota bacterium]